MEVENPTDQSMFITFLRQRNVMCLEPPYPKEARIPATVFIANANVERSKNLEGVMLALDFDGFGNFLKFRLIDPKEDKI